MVVQLEACDWVAWSETGCLAVQEAGGETPECTVPTIEAHRVYVWPTVA